MAASGRDFTFCGNSSTLLLPQRRRIYRRAIRSGPIAHAMRRLLRPQYRLLPPIQWHHPAQHALQIGRHIGIGEQWIDNRRGQQRQSQQAPGLRYIDAFGSGNVSDRPKLAFIEQALPEMRTVDQSFA